MGLMVTLPLLLPLLSAALLLALHRKPAAQAALGVAGAAGLLVCGLALLVLADRGRVLVVQIGSWAAPFGITLVADRLSTLLVALAGVMGLVVSLYGLGDVQHSERHGGFYPLLHGLLLGCCGAFLTGDLFNLYVWFEVLLISSFALLALGGGRSRMEATMKYLVLNLVGSMVFLIGIGILYGAVKTLNMADLHGRVAALHAARPELALALAGMFLLAFSLKAALFPLFFWLPASYHVPSASTCAIFAALLTKVGIYSLLRVLLVVFSGLELPLLLLLILTSVTMLSGVLGAIHQFEIKRILAWHSVSQVGYIVVGLGLLLSPSVEVRLLGLGAAVVFLVHHGLVKPALFLIGGLVSRAAGTTRLSASGGLALTLPWLAALFLAAGLSLAGIPPLSGFWAKLAVIRAALAAEQYLVAAVALAAGLLTLLSMIKIWNEAFWKNPVAEAGSPAKGRQLPQEGLADEPLAAGQPSPLPLAMVLPTAGLVLLVTLLGLFPQPLLGYADRTAAQVLDVQGYVEAVGVEAGLAGDVDLPPLGTVEQTR